MSLPPLPQFADIYEGSKQRYLIQILETSFRDFYYIQQKVKLAPTINTFVSTSGNLSTNETTLFTSPVSTTLITGNTWQIYIKSYGTFAGNGNTKELKLYLNNTVIYDSGALSVNGGSWNIDGTICWNGSTLQQNMVTTNSSNPSFPSTAVYSSSSVAFNSTITVSLTGTGQASNDIVGQVMIVTVQPN